MLKPIGIIEFIQLAKSGRILIDARSPKEFEQGHVPGALNLPLLNNEERHQVGITYKEHGRDAAVRLGFELVGHKFAHYIDAAKLMASEGKILLYCWRGGIRSNTLGWLLSSAGMEVLLLEGGYKEYRQWCLSHFEHKWPLMVLSGKTGAGKTEILHELAHYGESIIDLEALANHRGSAFGALGLSAQPSQETFENELAWALHNCLSASRVWIENESRFIGKIRIPDSFFNQAGKADLISINRDVNSRADRILQEYGQFDKEMLAEKTRSITKRMGGDRVKASVEALENGDLLGWVLPLLDYYDRNYDHSIQVRSGKYQRELNVQSQSAKEIARELLRLKTHS